MSEFHRMITYLYLYEQNVKSRNIGFAKVEKRSQRCLLEIHMKNTGCSLSPVPVYLYVQKGEKLAGISLGNFTLARGCGDFKCILDAENLLGSGYSLNDVKGIYIPLTERIMLVSQWDDDEFNQQNFTDLAKLTASESSPSPEPKDSTEQSHGSQSSLTPESASAHPTAFPSPRNNPAATPSHTIPNSAGIAQNNRQKPAQPSVLSTSDAAHDKSIATAGSSVLNTSDALDDKHLAAADNNRSFESPRNPQGKYSAAAQRPSPPQNISAAASPTAAENSSENFSISAEEQSDKMKTERQTAPETADALKALEALPRAVDRTVGFRMISGISHTGKNLQTNRIPMPNGRNLQKDRNPQANGKSSHANGNSQTDDHFQRNNDSPQADRNLPKNNGSPQADRNLPKNNDSPQADAHLKMDDKDLQADGHSQTNDTDSQAGRNFQTSRQVSKKDQTTQTPEHTAADAPEDWRLRWRFILENFPVMTPFSGDEKTLCVRMELKDLRQLPRQFWYLGNNSFLLHGFFNYRYLILGMTEEFGVKKWFVGIPGVFQNPERVMAALFGFPEFRSEKPSPINTGQFGYWYRYLNELSEPVQKDNS